MSSFPQVRRIVSGDEEIGMGYDSGAGVSVGTALTGFSVGANPVAPGQKVFSAITIVNSHEELLSELGMSFEAQGRYGFFQASAKADFADSTEFNSTSTFIVAKCTVRNPFTRGRDFALTAAAQRLVDTNRHEEFARAFGDSFVRGLQTGGEFYAVIRITSVMTSTQTELALALQAEYNGLVGAGEFTGRFTKANASTVTQAEFQATMYQEAGSGPTIAPITKVEELVPRFRDFPTIALASAAAYETELATYDTIPIPVPTPEEQENFEFALRDTRDQKLRFIQARNDLTFALRNPQFFGTLPGPDVLRGAITAYTRLVNACMDHAARLAHGEITPARTFDASTLTPPLVEPAPIPLPRSPVPTAAIIPVPNFVGLEFSEIDFAQRCLSFGTVDEALAGTVFPGEDGSLSPVSVSREVAVFLKTVITGHGHPGLKDSLPPSVFDQSFFQVRAQFPAAGGFISPSDTLVLQYEEIQAPQ